MGRRAQLGGLIERRAGENGRAAEHEIPHATACRALSVSQAWFYEWRDGDPSAQHARREQLKVAIRRGSPCRAGRKYEQD